MVTLREITRENYEECLRLQVTDAQKSFVASNVYSLAQAWVFSRTAYPFAIYADEDMVGFVMMGYYAEKDLYDIWRLMIDQKHQHRGYGRAALHLAIAHLRQTFGAQKIYLSFEPSNSVAEHLYQSVGFERTGEVDDGEIIMCLSAQ